MNGYEPVDISYLCNAGQEILRSDVNVDKGSQTLRGIPFRIGDESSNNCFIALDASSGKITVPISKQGFRVIFAHSLMETSVHEGSPLGMPVADYVFKLVDGTEHKVQIRERFEIASGPIKGAIPGVPGRPFRAFPDRKHLLFDRYDGNWDLVGRRQTEVIPEESKLFYLWSWENPASEMDIQSVDIIPAGPLFIVGGITVGQVDENPFYIQRRRPVKISLDNDLAQADFDLSVEVDRGISTYPNPLPQNSPEEFLAASFKGWGSPQNEKSSPSYVELAATPSASVTLNQSGKKIGDVNWGDVEDKKIVKSSGIRWELLDRGRNWVNVTVLDDSTGQPVPCRIHFRSVDGIPYQPHGHHNHVNSNLDTWHLPSM